MLVMGFIAVAVPIIISVKHQKDVRVGGEDRQQTPAGQQQEKFEDCCDDFAAVDPAPFESLGIRLVAMLGLHVPLDRFKVMLASVADLVSEPVLVSLVCCPIGFYYFGYALLSRFMPKVGAGDDAQFNQAVTQLSTASSRPRIPGLVPPSGLLYFEHHFG